MFNVQLVHIACSIYVISYSLFLLNWSPDVGVAEQTFKKEKCLLSCALTTKEIGQSLSSEEGKRAVNTQTEWK